MINDPSKYETKIKTLPFLSEFNIIEKFRY